MQNSKIEWCHHTFNAWEGCEKVSAGCANCYTERRDKQYHNGEHWGPTGIRKMMSEAYWKQPLKWNRGAQQAGERRRVFCSSLADVFEDRSELVEPRRRLFSLINETPDLDWLLLTKRPENIERLFDDIRRHFGWDENLSVMNIWLGTTVESQKEKRRINELRKIPAAVRFLSCEPLLEDLSEVDLAGIHWVIAGGESGPNARPMHPDWVRSLRDQCVVAKVAFFFKQWGEYVPTEVATLTDLKETGAFPVQVDDIDFRSDGVITGKVSDVRSTTNPRRDGLPVGITYQHWIDRDERLGHEQTMRRVGKKAAGRLLDGRTWDEFPKAEGE